jgi:hypothetical protein
MAYNKTKRYRNNRGKNKSTRKQSTSHKKKRSSRKRSSNMRKGGNPPTSATDSKEENRKEYARIWVLGTGWILNINDPKNLDKLEDWMKKDEDLYNMFKESIEYHREKLEKLKKLEERFHDNNNK